MGFQHPFLARVQNWQPNRPYGRVIRLRRNRIDANGPAVPLGTLCEIDATSGPVLAEVAAVEQNHIVLIPVEDTARLSLGAYVRERAGRAGYPAGDGFRGRVIDPVGLPMDGRGPIDHREMRENSHVPLPSERASERIPIVTGLRAIDGLMPLAKGQRIGVIAASGVGKTTLIEQIAIQTDCDHCILCLVGERGREVEAFARVLRRHRQPDRFTIVAATSDRSAQQRIRCVEQALALAEYWRDAGRHVLLVVDSVTRLAMAHREIGLAAGEPPTVRAYPPSIFSALPRLVERCGALNASGAITAVMTVLSETDDNDDPIVEVMKSLLDGHILLSRALAEQGHFPAIDISRSISRLSTGLMSAAHAAAARKAVAALGTYEQSRIMVESGIYQPGQNRELDRAIDIRGRLLPFLQQATSEAVSPDKTVAALERAVMHG